MRRLVCACVVRKSPKTGFSRQGPFIFVVVVFSGEVGDWKNHFTVAQNELYDQIIEEGLKGSMLKAFDYVL